MGKLFSRLPRVVSFVLSLAILLLCVPAPIHAETAFTIPDSDKVYALSGVSGNSKNSAEYIAVDKDIIYVIFTVRKDKYFKEGSVNVPSLEKTYDLIFTEENRAYDHLIVHNTELMPEGKSDGKYVWQVGYFTLKDVNADAHLIISAVTGSGGFDVDNVEYTLQVKYGMTVTKELVAVNDQAVADTAMVNVGDKITWHIKVQNSGDIDLTGITVDDKLPGTELDFTGPFDLAAHETKTIVATYIVRPEDAGQEIINVVAAKTEDNMVESGASGASKIYHAVVYDPNGGTDAPNPQSKLEDSTVTISDGIPVRPGHVFKGWNTAADGTGMDYPAGTEYSENANLVLYAKWEKMFCVRFHANLPGLNETVFRTYYPATGQIPAGGLPLAEDNTVPSFYDIPTLDYENHNRYIFKGWYLADGTPMDWTDVYAADTDLYAHWIETGSVTQSAQDGKVLPTELGGAYPGYELVGIQLRGDGPDNQEHYGEVGSGLRFVAVLSQQVYSQINALPGNEGGAEYGFVMAKAATIPEGVQLLYKGSNVNGQNTKTSHSFVVNLKCSGVPDHFSNTDESEDGYRLYTGVVTYKSAAAQGEEVLQQAYSQNMVTRAYIRYYDANGLLRTYHSNYTGSSRTAGGCSASYNMALEMLQKQ